MKTEKEVKDKLDLLFDLAKGSAYPQFHAEFEAQVSILKWVLEE